MKWAGQESDFEEIRLTGGQNQAHHRKGHPWRTIALRIGFSHIHPLRRHRGRTIAFTISFGSTTIVGIWGARSRSDWLLFTCTTPWACDCLQNRYLSTVPPQTTLWARAILLMTTSSRLFYRQRRPELANVSQTDSLPLHRIQPHLGRAIALATDLFLGLPPRTVSCACNYAQTRCSLASTADKGIPLSYRLPTIGVIPHTQGRSSSLLIAPKRWNDAGDAPLCMEPSTSATHRTVGCLHSPRVRLELRRIRRRQHWRAVWSCGASPSARFHIVAPRLTPDFHVHKGTVGYAEIIACGHADELEMPSQQRGGIKCSALNPPDLICSTTLSNPPPLALSFSKPATLPSPNFHYASELWIDSSCHRRLRLGRQCSRVCFG